MTNSTPTSPDPAQVAREFADTLTSYISHDERPTCRHCELATDVADLITQQVTEVTALLRLALDNANKLIGANADEYEQTVAQTKRETWESAATLAASRHLSQAREGIDNKALEELAGECRRRAGE